VLVHVTRTRHFAWCDRCLRGSPMYELDAPLVAIFFAIEELRAAGWVHVAEPAHRESARQDAERTWANATYCPECAARMRARIGSFAPPPLVSS
jgi:hypothetical protein